MILINDEVLIRNTIDLNEFIEELRGQKFDGLSDQIIDCIVDYLLDVWKNIEKSDIMVKKHISKDLNPVAIVDITEVSDYQTIEIRAFSTDKNYEPKEADVKAFNELCGRYFNPMKSLYDRLIEVEVE